MSENCTHNCETCGMNCPSRTGGAPQDMREKPHELSSIKMCIRDRAYKYRRYNIR